MQFDIEEILSIIRKAKLKSDLRLIRFMEDGQYIALDSALKPILAKGSEELNKIIGKNHTLFEEKSKDIHVSSRVKSASSLFFKIIRVVDHTKFRFGDISEPKDILGIRYICNGESDCYWTIDRLLSTYPVCNRIVDYIAFPDVSGYKSIDFNINFNEIIAQIQIRTFEMDKFAKRSELIREIQEVSSLTDKLKVDIELSDFKEKLYVQLNTICKGYEAIRMVENYSFIECLNLYSRKAYEIPPLREIMVLEKYSYLKGLE